MKVNWQKVVIFLSVIYVVCLILQTTVTINYLTGKVSTTEAEVSLTISGTTPTISNIDPDGSQYINTRNITISFTTSEDCNCSYSQTATDYEDMIRMENSLESTNHNHTLINLVNQQYTYNFKCIDTQEEESALTILTFTTSIVPIAENVTYNETDFSIWNYTGETRKIEQINEIYEQRQVDTNITIPGTNYSIELTLTMEPNKTREIFTTEDYVVVSPTTANIRNVTADEDANSLITKILESDANYSNQEQSITIVTNETKQYTVDLYVKEDYTRDFAIIEDTYLFVSPLTAQINLFNKTSDNVFECEIEETNSELINTTQTIVIKTDTNAQFEFNLTLSEKPRKIKVVTDQKLAVSPEDANISSINYTTSNSQLDVTLDGDDNQTVVFYVSDKGIPISIKFDGLEMESTEWSYDSGTSIVSVNASLGSAHNISVSWYSAPTPTPTPTPDTDTGDTGAAGGGGGAIEFAEKYFTIDQNLIKLMLRQGQSLTRIVNIENTGNSILKFTITIPSKLSKVLSMQEQLFTLKPGEQKELTLNFITTETTLPDVYNGKIKIKADGTTKQIPTIVEVESKRILFDISLDIVADNRRVKPGQELSAQLTLFNLQRIGETDVEIFYFIKDQDGKIITQSKEVVTVDEQASFVRTFRIPDNLANDDYILVVQARYDGDVGTASELFEVSTRFLEIPAALEQFTPTIMEKISIINTIYLLAILILISTIVYLFIKYEHNKPKKSKKQYKKELKEKRRLRDKREKSKLRQKRQELKQKQEKRKLKQKKKKKQKRVKTEKNKAKLKSQKQKLVIKLRAIERAHKLKYIENKTYRKGKAQLNDMIREINKRLKNK